MSPVFGSSATYAPWGGSLTRPKASLVSRVIAASVSMLTAGILWSSLIISDEWAVDASNGIPDIDEIIDVHLFANRLVELDVPLHGLCRDEEIDAVNNSLFRELLTYMMEDPRNITFCTHLLFCAKNIERMGDHATNIAETVHYIVEGRSLPDERPKSDLTSFARVPLRK